MISEPELEDVYHGFDLNNDGHVTKAEFVGLWTSLTHQNQEHAEAYFYLADLNDDNIIDEHDLNPLYNVFDLDGDGSVTAQEFAQKWVGIIMEIPVAVLFERSDVNKDNHLTSQEFSKFFSSFDQNSDNSVNKQEFENGWTKAGFGLMAEADTFFAKLDLDQNGALNGQDMTQLFTKYDLNKDNMMMILEATQMSLLLPKPNING
uniref:Putative insoluble matrix shell protein 5-like protein n=1 Tax=Pinctada fucata TaxID=50426 RepID=A0A194ANK5_PINFU